MKMFRRIPTTVARLEHVVSGDRSKKFSSRTPFYGEKNDPRFSKRFQRPVVQPLMLREKKKRFSTDPL